MATLTYSYSDSTAVLGPLAGTAEPHTYDLCNHHTERLTVPLGWEVVRLPLRESDLVRRDDLLAVADAVRAQVEAVAPEPVDDRRPSRPGAAPVTARQPQLPFGSPAPSRGRHLRAVDEPS